MTEPAPAKLNLCLFLGPARASDGRHELVSLMQSLTWGDEVCLAPAPADELACPGVEGPNLAWAALEAFRAATGRLAEPQRLEVRKRVPVAAGLGGGSADAAAALRLAARAGALEDRALLMDLAASLGADVPAQLRPGAHLALGAGERLEAAPAPAPFGVLLLPSPTRLSTAAVYAEADRLGLARERAELDRLAERVRAALGARPFGLPGELLVNDLQPAAASLCPPVEQALAEARRAGARHVLLCGSGPTVAGLFDSPQAARDAAAALAARRPAPVATTPLGA